MGAQDIAEIQQLAVRYADAISRGDVHAAVQVYAADGSLETPTTEPARGRQNVEKTIAQTVATLEFVFQTVSLGVIEVDGSHAAARFPITEWARREGDGRPFLFLGWYEDDLELRGGSWCVTRRRLTPRLLGRPEFLGGQLHPAPVGGVEVQQ
ncbi:MAG: nuclear transport factor 2 family protein [Aeromicrobium sp.]